MTSAQATGHFFSITCLPSPTRAPAACPTCTQFTRGLDLDIQAATAALTMPHHNGRTEGVNTRTSKMIKRQMYGRAGFTLLRHRILLS